MWRPRSVWMVSRKISAIGRKKTVGIRPLLAVSGNLEDSLSVQDQFCFGGTNGI